MSMDRREFLKLSSIGVGAAVLAPSELGASGPETAPTKLKSTGSIREKARKISVVDSADVLVVGGGPAGFAAAVSAARNGADVMMLDRQYFLGGLFTGCGVTPIINMFSPVRDGRVQAVSGIASELCARLDAVGALSLENVRPKVDPEAAKYFMEEIVSEAGVRILYGVQAAQVVMSGNRITHVIIEGKSGRVAIAAKFVIDCTGDGDILEWTGEDFQVYLDNIGAMWRIGNAENGKGSETCYKGVRTRHTVGEKNQDGLDMYNLTRVQIALRKKMWEDAQEQRKKPGCGDLFLLDTPSVVGVRVTRVLNSVGNVTLEGAMSKRVYPDAIGYAGADSRIKYNGVRYAAVDRPVWQVPYSAITPKKVANLLVAGRCFGFERPLTYDAREIGTCLMTGQAAGAASAIAVASRCSCREVDIDRLQRALTEGNAIIKGL